jgi:pyruvate dehydrogenase E2 component (dihydrolipoamide acetyltransferase)
MPFDFALPDLGEGITEGEIRKWIVKEGDAIEEHQTVLEIETDKAIVEVPSPRKGKVLEIRKKEGEIAQVGETLMTISAEEQTTEQKSEVEEIRTEKPKSFSVVGVLPEEEEEPAAGKAELPKKEKESPAPPTQETDRAPGKGKPEKEIRATPAVRAMAKDMGLSLETISGSGPSGSITEDDLKKITRKEPVKKDQIEPVERMPLRGLRRTIAKNLMTSQQKTVSVTGMDEADITELWELREREKEALKEKGIHLTFLPFFIKAVQHSLTEHPMLNASLDETKDEIVTKKYFHIGVAVDTPEGLMVPVIRDADRKTILELAEDIQQLGRKARERKITMEEMKGGTFTITNYGHFGATFATPVINYPEVAILGTGKITEKPWVKDGKIVIRKILPLSLTFDHRVTDGVDASQFLTKIIRYLEDPGLLFLESA